MATAQIDFSKYEGAPAAIDFSKYENSAPTKPGFWERAYETSGAKGLIDTAKQRDADLMAMYSRVGGHLQNGDFGGALSELGNHALKVGGEAALQDPAVAIIRSQASQIPKAIAAAKAGDYSTAVGRGLAAVTPLVGPAAADTGEKLGTDVGQGNFAGAAGDIAGFTGPLLAGKAAARIGPAIAPAVGKVAAAVKEVATPENLATVGGTAAGGYLGHLVGEPLGASVAGGIGGKIFGKALAKQFAAPPAEVLNAPLAETPPSAPTEAPETAPAASQGPAAPPKTTIKPAQVEQSLREALGGTAKNVPIYQRATSAAASPASAPETAVSPVSAAPVSAPPTPAEVQAAATNPHGAPAPVELPEGFTPVESSVLKGYKYDPAAREFDAVLNSGDHYRMGDVGPEDVEAFEKADSQGSAWTKIIRQRGTPLGKMVDGVLKPWRTQGVTATAEGELLDRPPGDALSQKLANLQNFIKPTKSAAATKAPIPETQAPVPETQSPISATQPLNVFRSRSIGEQGIPYNPESRAQATMSEAEGRRIMPNREDIEGKPQELIQTNLADAPAFSVLPRGTSPSWIKFHAEIPEGNIANAAAARAAQVLDPGDLTALLKETLRQAKAKVKP